LFYLDEDDGETILVGSSLELQQRLDEPIPPHAVTSASVSSATENMDSSFHTFDITKTPASLATWREHEAYTSKTLRKLPLKSRGAVDPPTGLANTILDSMQPLPTPQRQTDRPVSVEDAIKSALQGLESHVGAFAGFLQETSKSLRTIAENTREADVSAIGGIINGFNGIFSEVGKVGKAMAEAFDADTLAPSSSVSQAVVEDLASRKPGIEKRQIESSSNSKGGQVTGLPANVQVRGRTLAEADSSEKPATSWHATFAASSPHEGASPLDPERHQQVTAKLLSHSRIKGAASHTEVPLADKSSEAFAERYMPIRHYPTLSERYNEFDTGLSAHVRSTKLASSSETPQHQATSAPFAAYASLKDPWKISSERSLGHFSGCDYCRRTKVCDIYLHAIRTCTIVLTSPIQTHCRRSFSGGACQTCVLEKQPCSFFAEPTPEDSSFAPTASRPGGRYHHEIHGSKSDDLEAQDYHPPHQLNTHRIDQVQLPRETAKTYAQSSKTTASRSILDLENSDPDFSTRYPPLMSLRKSKTIASLAGRSRSPFLATINPESAITRFPSLSQIEHEARTDRRVESIGEDQDASTKRQSFTKDNQNFRQPAIRPRLVIPARSPADVGPAPPPKLLGAWPGPRPEADGPTLPTSEESSGAFFDRMTRSRSPEPATRSFRYIPAHLRHSRPAGTPYVSRHAQEPLKADTTFVPPHLRHSFSIDTAAPRLGRSNTVTASNPAARLTQPFDPLDDARQSRNSNALPRRSGTERHRRRPYNESFTGAGRMPWESFEHTSEATRHEHRASRRETKPFKGSEQSSALAGFGISDKVGDCVRKLRDMGYGNRSPHEASRLSIYAAVCNGVVADAVEMIEEDRKAGRQQKDIGDRLGVRPFNHNDRPAFGR
jgi:hypothetical protein